MLAAITLLFIGCRFPRLIAGASLKPWFCAISLISMPWIPPPNRGGLIEARRFGTIVIGRMSDSPA